MRCNASGHKLKLEAAVVVLHKVGGGAVVNFDHPNKYSVTVTVTVGANLYSIVEHNKQEHKCYTKQWQHQLEVTM